ncbi:hypothetical protein BH10BDE1_BH10BDE1_29930 [soil metagenome]
MLFSGGTDSTCATAVAALEFDCIHLLTFHEKSTSDSPIPTENADRLRRAFPNVEFTHSVISTERLVSWLSYGDSFLSYIRNLAQDHVYNLATPGFSSLSWHLATLRFASGLRNSGHDVSAIFDGMTRELTHLPGHMPSVRNLIAALYAKNGFKFSSPVYDFPVPPDQRFVDRMVVDRHGFALSDEILPSERTTGTYLYERGILPHPNVKGSLFDNRMQHDCYPFVVYNLLIFWFLMPLQSWNRIEERITRLIAERILRAEKFIGDWSNPIFEEPFDARKE